MPSFEKNPLWQFTDDNGGFRMVSPEAVSRLYFPLANEAGILSSITPDLHGDIKTSLNSFLMPPVTTDDLHETKSSRNFWVYLEGRGAWSATGVSAVGDTALRHKNEEVTLDAGPLWHRVIRENKDLGLRSDITNFIPVSNDTVEIMVVTLTNTGRSSAKLTPTSAVPIFGRSADNLRDHYHVTSLLHRILPHPGGVVVKPMMTFDERGHKLNETVYAVLGASETGEHPAGCFYTVPDFVGEGGNLEAPRAILENRHPHEKEDPRHQGKSAIGALRFRSVTLPPRHSASFVLMLGIAANESQLDGWLKKFGSLAKAKAALDENKACWTAKASQISFHTQDRHQDRWLRWVGLQPTFRKLFGNSFLPDFDYGRGGRGWRDLWQDCLALLLGDSEDARSLLLHNFNGVRIDGSNATIIGSDGSFVADRNNITRVWMDHGVWPYITLELYLHQTGDADILFEDAHYFRDMQQSRAAKKDLSWKEEYGRQLKDKRGKPVKRSVLEHLLVQHLVQFFNVGEHNHIRLENADWNDGIDMAHQRGESVAFTCLYASNLKRLADLLESVAQKKKIKKVSLSKELLLLLDRVRAPKVRYDSVAQKRKRLEKYFDAVQPAVSGTAVDVRIVKLVSDLREKSKFLSEHVRREEWLWTREGDGLYNGYYDNHGRRVEGQFAHGMRLTLAGQTFPVMSGIADAKQVVEIFKTVKKYLKDREHGGFRLNTDFRELRPDLGRAFSFVYGEKENGAFFSHMAVMFSSALYQRGFVAEGREVLDSIYRMCVRTEKSRIYPGLPEYFNSEGRGMYHYLTGSASWFVLTMLTQVFGVRGRFGDLLLEPKLSQQDFDSTYEVAVRLGFAGRKFRVSYRNPKKLSYQQYCVSKISLNGKELRGVELNKKEALIPRETLLKNTKKSLNVLAVTLE